MDKRKGTCRRCKKEVNTEDVRRKYGSCSHVYMLSYCSAQCYTKDSKVIYKAWYHEETKDKWLSEKEPYERWLERKLYDAQISLKNLIPYRPK